MSFILVVFKTIVNGNGKTGNSLTHAIITNICFISYIIVQYNMHTQRQINVRLRAGNQTHAFKEEE